MATISSDPTYPVPNRQATLTMTLVESGSNWVRIWCTVAPDASQVAQTLIKSNTHRVVVYEGAGGANEPWRWTPDAGGKYTFAVQEYTRGGGFSGGYAGDTAAAPTETKCGLETTLYFYVGQRLTAPIGVGHDTASIVLWIWNATIRATSLQVHGEATPALTSQTPSAAAAIAMASTTVVNALAALVDVAVSTAVGTISTIVSDMVSKINAHIIVTAGSVHNAADSDNDIPIEFACAPGPGTLQEFVNATLPLLRRHRLNDCGGTSTTAPGPGTAEYHKLGGVRKADQTNQPLYGGVGSLADAYAALADIWRVHEAHRVSTAVHGAADSTNALTALPVLLALHKVYLDVLASYTPTAPPAAQSGAVTLIAKAGFVES